MDALTIASMIGRGEITAREVMAQTLRRIESGACLNAFTQVFPKTALRDACALDERIARGEGAAPLAGVPFAVKNNFDVAGVVTLAGAKLLRGAPPAKTDAVLVARLKTAGAILVGTVNMDEFAYGFVTENAHYGPTRNPHDPTRTAGGSSGGSAAAVAAGLVPLALGSDTNGSIRVPAGLCGVFGLKPTYQKLSCAGLYPFADSLDHAGLFARTVDDLDLAYRALVPDDHASDKASPPPLRVGVLGGWFQAGASAEVLEALEVVARALGARRDLDMAGAAASRSAAFCLTAYEGGRLHAAALARQPQDFDPAVRDRLIAGALLPDDVAEHARRLQPVFADAARALFEEYDILLAPTTPCTAPKIGEAVMIVDGETAPVRQNLGAYTQPLSFIGLPVLSAPVNRPGRLPVGVQIVAPPGCEDRLLAVARDLQGSGVIASHRPGHFYDDQ